MRTIYIDADACPVTHIAVEDDRRFAESFERLIAELETF